MSRNTELGREQLQLSLPGKWGCVNMGARRGPWRDLLDQAASIRRTTEGLAWWAAVFKGAREDRKSLGCL